MLSAIVVPKIKNITPAMRKIYFFITILPLCFPYKTIEKYRINPTLNKIYPAFPKTFN